MTTEERERLAKMCEDQAANAKWCADVVAPGDEDAHPPEFYLAMAFDWRKVAEIVRSEGEKAAVVGGAPEAFERIVSQAIGGSAMSNDGLARFRTDADAVRKSLAVPTLPEGHTRVTLVTVAGQPAIYPAHAPGDHHIILWPSETGEDVACIDCIEEAFKAEDFFAPCVEHATEREEADRRALSPDSASPVRSEGQTAAVVGWLCLWRHPGGRWNYDAFCQDADEATHLSRSADLEHAIVPIPAPPVSLEKP